MIKMAKHKTLRKAIRQLAELAETLGFQCSYTAGNHLRFEHWSHATVYGASTPSCPRSVANTISKLRRAHRIATHCKGGHTNGGEA